MNDAQSHPLSPLELDALVELINLGVSKAAVSLREMVGQQILLSVPNVKMLARGEAVAVLRKSEPSQLVAVHQVFEGDIVGRALLIFPETKSLELVRAVTSGNLPLEDIIELEQEALAETGNIILNGCLATIANELRRTLRISLPEILRGDSEKLFNLTPPPEAGDVVLFVYINFSVQHRDIQGYIAMLMDMPSLAALQILVREYIRRVTGESAFDLMPEACHSPLPPIIDSLDIGLIVLNDKRQVVVWNSWIATMCGVKAADATGRLLGEIFPGRAIGQLQAAARSAFEAGVSSLMTHSLHPSLLPLRTRAGRPLVHDVMVSAIGDRSSPRCLIQVVDVTVAAARDRVLRDRQNARYDAVVDSASDVIITLDDNSIIQLANPAAQRQFGYSAEELLGKPSEFLFPGQRVWDETIRAVMEARPTDQPILIVARRKEGTFSNMEVSMSQWRADSRVFVTAILRDINERLAMEEARRRDAHHLAELNATLEHRVAERTAQLMKVEEALRQSQKMEAIGQLTGGIAHDFNNLLQGIIGSLDRVRKRVSEGKINDVERFVDGALASANCAAAMTHRLLAFSRRQPVDPRPVDINLLIGSVEELLRHSLGASIRMDVVPQESLWLVRCDSNQLENALLNLAINARDAMPGGGSLTIATSQVVVERRQAILLDVNPGDFVMLRVSDTGAGMPDDVRARAFDPFYTTKPIGQGTGLGLSMIYGFVRQSDGAIRIESEVSKGTMVEIFLPRYVGDAELQNNEDGVATLHHAGGEIVLVAEDEAVVRMLVVELLEERGFRVLEAADGPSALRILQSNQRVDLLISDIGLPKLNGRQLADAAREKRPTLKVLFMTGYAETAAGRSFLEEGMEIIAKPFDMDALAHKVQQMIDAKA